MWPLLRFFWLFALRSKQGLICVHAMQLCDALRYLFDDDADVMQ